MRQDAGRQMPTSFNRSPIRQKPPALPALSRQAEEEAIAAWLKENAATRADPAYAAPSQAAAPAPDPIRELERPVTWSRAPRQDIEASLDEIARLHGLGLSSYAIGKRLGCDHRCVEYRLKRLKLQPHRRA